MFKRIISFLTFISIISSLVFPCMGLAEEEKYSSPVILPAHDTFIRVNDSGTNFEQNETIVVDASSDNKRISFIEFSIDGYDEYISRATEIFLTLCTNGGDETSGYRFVVIPLEGEYKNIDLTTITYNSATAVKSNNVSIIDYMPSGAQQYAAYSNAKVKIDVTDYCKSLTDGRALFMIKSVSGAYTMEAKETISKGAEPSLTIESSYTGILNTAHSIAAQLSQKYDSKSISSNVSFETEMNGYNIRFISKNPDYISDNGTLLQRPLSNENDKTVGFGIEVTHSSYPLVKETTEFDLKLLKLGSTAASSVEVTENEAEFNFDNLDVSNQKHILCFEQVNLDDGCEYSLYHGSQLIETFVADCTKSCVIADVSAYVSGSSESFTLKGSISRFAWDYIPTVSNISSSAFDAIMSLYSADLGDLTHVTADLNLPDSFGDYQISWSSSEKSVLADSGRVERGENDTTSVLTASLNGSDCAFELSYTVNVIRENTDIENNLYPELNDPMHTSDEALFGKWDSADGSWIQAPLLRYDKFSGLSQVERAAKQGDYEDAKSLLLAYYRSKNPEEILTFIPETDYDVKAAAMDRKIWTYAGNNDIIAEADIGNEWGWYTIDLTGHDKTQNGTYWIMDADMDGTHIEIESKENPSGHRAYVEIIANGQKRTYPVVADTYISAGDKINTNFGSEEILYCREAAGDAVTPFGADSARPYFRFGFTPDNISTITSVKLNFYGRATGNKPKKVYCLTTVNEKNFEETELTWETHYPQAFCFKETGYIWKTVSEYSTQWHTEYEWINYSSRLYQSEWLLTRYMVTRNEDYAYRALEIAMSQYTQQPNALYPRNLEGGWRAEKLIRTMYTAIDSEHMTPEIFAAFLKWIFDHADGLKDQNAATANWNSAFKVNFARICAFFPEIAKDGWWQKAKDNLYKLYSTTFINEDGSYVEACTNYINGVIREFEGALDIIGAIDGEDDEYYIYFKNQLEKLLIYFANVSYPWGIYPPYGDGGRGGNYAICEEANEYVKNDNVGYIASFGEDGVKPDYTSILFPSKAICVFKSGWHKEDLSGFFNNDGGGTHGHYDDLGLDISAFGRFLLVDAGVSTYSEGSAFAAVRYDTINHNTIQIDDKNQTFSGGGNSPGLMDLKTNGTFDYLRSDSDNKMYDGMDVNRNVLFLKNKFAIVSDIIVPYDDAPHTYRQLWHPDYNFNMTLESDTNLARTNFSAAPNIKIIPADTGEDAKLFTRMMFTPSQGETESRSVQYYKENVTGVQTFDTVLYPENTGEDHDVRVTRINLLNTPLSVATSFMINMDDDIAYFYSSNEDTHSERSFGNYTYSGELAYVEENDDGNITYLAVTNGNSLLKNGAFVISSSESLKDFSAKFESNSLKLYTSEPLPQSGVTVAVDYVYDTVYLNDEKVEFDYSNGYITTNGTLKTESETGGLNPGIPTSPSTPSAGNVGGSGVSGSSPVVPQIPQQPISDYPFEDAKNHWANDYILALYAKGIVSGVSKSGFAPDRYITRAEFAKIIVSVCGLPMQSKDAGFTDVTSGAWYSPYVNTAYELGIISGYDDGTFRPDSMITREEMAKMLCVAADIMKKHNGVNSDISYTDNGDISQWAYLYVKKASGLGLFEGDANNFFNPLSTATRAESAAVVCRLLSI